MKLEDKIQAECFQWSWNELPETRKLICYNLNNSKNKIDGNLNKAKGLIKGRADLTFYWKGKAYFLECKTKTGKQRPGQPEFQKVVESNGFDYYIFRSLEEFQKIIKSIICTQTLT